MTPHLREYRAEDFETLHKIDGVCFDTSIAYSRRDLRDYLRIPGADCLIAEDTGEITQKIIGFIITVCQRPEGYIVTLDVLPNQRRHAAGSALLAEAEKRMAARGAREVSLETATDNASAIAFWHKHGYRTRGVIKGYYPGNRDAYSMIKALPSPARNRKARS